jgi:hypothetical protein
MSMAECYGAAREDARDLILVRSGKCPIRAGDNPNARPALERVSDRPRIRDERHWRLEHGPLSLVTEAWRCLAPLRDEVAR